MFLHRLPNQSKVRQNMLYSIFRFNADLKDFLHWLTKVEIVLKHHGEILFHDNLKDGLDQNKHVQEAFRVRNSCLNPKKCDTSFELDRLSGTGAHLCCCVNDSPFRQSSTSAHSAVVLNRMYWYPLVVLEGCCRGTQNYPDIMSVLKTFTSV